VSDELPESMKPTLDAVERLHKLLQDPHPGLFSWLSMTGSAARDLFKILKDGGAGSD